MIRTLIASAALAAGLIGQAGAVPAATTVLVDDFSQEDQFAWNGGPLVDYPAAAPTVVGTKRTVTHSYAGTPFDPADGWLIVGPNYDAGQLSVSNGAFTSTGTVAWALPAGYIPGTGTDVATLKFDVISSNPSATATLKLGGNTVDTQTYGSGVVSFVLGASQDAINTSGGVLSLVFTGPTSYSMTIDNVRFEVSAVPETSTALMMLAGLLATAGMRQRFVRRETRV